MATALIHQIDAQQHIVGVVNDRLVAYLGWQRVRPEVAEAWISGKGPLLATEDGTALAVTLLAVTDPKFAISLLREAKRRNPSASVYWMRYYADRRPPTARVVRSGRAK